MWRKVEGDDRPLLGTDPLAPSFISSYTKLTSLPLLVQMFTSSLNNKVKSCVQYDRSFTDDLEAKKNIWITSSLDKQKCNFLRLH